VPRYDYLIVGAGFAGCVCAERLAAAGKSVLLIDKRSHVGGNAYDTHDENGVLIHPYGPHIFHTNSKRIFDYLSRFTSWRRYEHRVLAVVDGTTYPIPINRTTINRLYNLSLSEEQVEAYLASVRTNRIPPQNSEDVVLNSVGEDLCSKFFRGYTRKQWGLELSELSPGVAARIPTRINDDDRYFTDTYQFMPSDGYTSMFERMLSSNNISISLNTSWDELKNNRSWKHLIYTGPIDSYFDFCFGQLPYRSLHFNHQHMPDCNQYQQTGTINYPNDHAYTRITEFKHITGQKCPGTSIVREFPSATGDPYYPIPRSENEQIYKQYARLADEMRDAHFVGRLAQYRYYNMDQVVGAALSTSEKILNA
jgi:UDP-galactopyranose mutase